MNKNIPAPQNTVTRNNFSIFSFISVLRSISLVVLFFIITEGTFFGQAVGDYRSNGNGNWSTLGTWERLNALPNTWAAPTVGQGYPGQFASPSLVTIRNGNIVTLDVSPANNIGSIDIPGGNQDSWITYSGAFTLTVTGATTISSTSTGDWKAIYVNNGTYSTSSISLSATNNDDRDAFIEIAAGTVNVTGNITMNNTNPRTYVRFTGAGILNVGGTITGGGITSNNGGGATAPTSGTINYNNAGAQNLGSYTYYNLTISGGGTKTMQGNVTVNNTLSLSNGILSLGGATYNLIIANGASITTPGSFDNTHMITTDGTGYLYKYSDTSAPYVMTYPIGRGTNYTPMQISTFTATVAAGSYVRVRVDATAAIGPPAANSTDLQRYWSVTTSGLTGISADATFTYIDPADIGTGGDELTYFPAYYNGSSWTTPAGASINTAGDTFSTSGTTALTGQWTAREPIPTFYSYQSGDWANAGTWTEDPSGGIYTNPGSLIPGASDRAVILNGRTVTTAVSRSVFSLQINEGGILNIGTTSGHNFGTVSGQGKLILASANFPTGTFTDFVSAGGGTVEMQNASNFSFIGQFEFNNLILNLDNSGIIATLNNNPSLTINGDFTIERGVFRINDGTATARSVTVYGDVLVESAGRISVGTGNVGHTLTLKGDFTNQGLVRFTNQTAPVQTSYYNTLTNTGRVDAIFNNDMEDQYLQCDGITDFYRIEINKGIDWTYTLHIDANATGNFNLYGPNNINHTPGTTNPKAFGLTAGTVRLGTNISIPSLTMIDPGCAIRDYNINQNAQLLIDGANVITSHVVSSCAFTVYGKLAINNGTFDASNTMTSLIMREASNITINGGTVTATQLRTSNLAGIHRGAFIMTGGILNLTSNPNALCWADNSRRHATLSLPYPDNVFQMSDGTINILASTAPQAGADGTEGYDFSLVLSSDIGNVSVTGGTINITIPATRNAWINSTVPLWNLNIVGTNGTFHSGIYNFVGHNPPSGLTPQDLIVLNNLTFQNGAYFDNSINNRDVSIGGNFSINTGTTYVPGNNTTILNGSGTQLFDASGTITGNLQNLSLANTADVTLNGNSIYVDGNLTIGDGCTLRDNGRIVYVLGNIVNNGLHFKPVSGAGSIQLTGTAAQVISGDGTGIFNNLTLNKTGGSTTMAATMTVTGELRLANTTAVLNIGSNLLSLGTDANIYDATIGTTQNFNVNRMIRTNGLLSDDGLSRAYSNTSAYLFPFGFGTYYMPASIQFSSALSDYGTVNSKPVNNRHPLAQGTNNILTCYWHTSGIGFGSIPAGSVRHLYYYNDAFVPVPANENLYVPAYYDNVSSWVYINNVNLVNEGTNEISYNTANSADGDYTAGETSAFAAIPILYSTGVNGDWDNTATWSETSVGGPSGSSLPGPNTLVIIGDDTHNHTITIYANSRQCGSLFIADSSTLDLQTYTGHNFNALPNQGVTGGGTLRIAANNYFPQGDFGDFIGPEGGTVEYYTTAVVGNIIIPTTSDVTTLTLSTYKNLKLTHSSTYTITLPDCDLTIYNDVTVSGSGTGSAGTRTAGTSRTYTINGNLNIISGVLEYRNGVVTTVKVLENTSVAAVAIFRTATTGAVVNNVLELYGSLSCDAAGTFDMNNTGRAYTYFKGATDDSISGAGTIDFYNLYVDKGTDTTSVLNVTADNITTGFTNPFLTLSNGTFRVNNSLLNLTLSTTNPFDVPSSACLSVEAGTVTIGTNDNNGDLYLSGKLEILGGIVNIGNGGAFNNDIQYASAGSPVINVAGGQLNVNGQIRRSTTITSGSLNYIQSAGDVIIYGRNQQANRAKLEITNTGSTFMTSGGTLTIWSAGGTTYGDIYIRPSTYSITGGTLNIGNATSAAGQVFDLSSSSPLWNLNIGTDAVNQTVDVSVLSLTIENDLIINGNSQLHANGYDISIGHDFTNENSDAGTGTSTGGYQPGSATQTTTFDGTTTQIITGNGANLTNFAHLVINSTINDTLVNNTNIRINGDLTLNSGRLADGGNIITVIGDIENNAIHSSYSGNGIVLAGTQKQTISGNGSGIFGNITINNSNGVDMVDNSTINNTLTFTYGFLYIDDYLLTLGLDALIGGTPGTNKMIMLNGTLSDLGVKKLFPSGASAAFVYPIGISGKYTPVTYTVSANSAQGEITVRPINSYHLAETDAAGNELAYYWSVVSTGFSSPTITHRYQYVITDVSGAEASYVIGQYDRYAYVWINLGDNTVDETNHWLDIANVNFISGEYTAGLASNFGTVVPLYSRNSRPTNDWTDPQSWTTNSDGSDCSDANCTSGHATLAPNGNPVTILTGHTILLDADNAIATSVVIDGTLDADATTYHNLGHVSGIGKLMLTSTADSMFVFPGGEYDDFMNTSSTIIEFTGTNEATLPLKPGNMYKPYQNIILSGTGQKNMSAEHMKVLGNLTISAGTVLSNSLYNKELHISGNWTDNNTSSTGGFVPGTGIVYFEGTTLQTLTVTNGATTEQFYRFAINNSSGVILAGGGQVNVSRYLYLTSGNITTNSTNLLSISYTSTSAIIGGGSSSFVDGPLRKNILTSQSFTFPVGDGTRYGQIVLLNTSVAVSPQYWTVTYNDTDPDPEDDDVLNSPISSISSNESWVVNRPAGGTANIRLRWDANSYPGVTSDPILRARLRVVEYDNVTGWTERGQSVSGTATEGTVSTTTPVSDDDYIFTLGVSGVTASINTPPATYTICDNGEIASVPVTLTGIAPWTLSYRTTGSGPTIRDFTQTGITSSTYTIQLTGTDMGGSAYSPYTLSLTSVSDNSTSGICNPTTVQITVDETYIPDIIGTFTVGSGETRFYSTANNVGSTYTWSWVGTGGGTILSPNSDTTSITFDAGTGTFQLQIEETSSTGCVATDIQSIIVSNVPTPDITPKTANICINDIVTYSTTYNAGNEYLWAVTNGTCPSCGTYSSSSSVDVTWNLTGNSSVSVRERIIATPAIFGDATENYYVSRMPVTQTLSADPICSGDPGFVLTGGSESGVSYQLRLNSDDSDVGSAVAGTGGSLSLPTGALTATTEYNVLAYNEGCQLRIPDAPGSVTVFVDDPPTASAGSDEAICAGDVMDLSTSSALPSASNYSSLSWATSGTGTFDDNTQLTPIYTPSVVDETVGFVVLTLTANGNGACTPVNDDMTLTINPMPTPSVSGNADVCEAETHTYSTGASGNDFLWAVVGGTIDSGQGTNEITVTWDILLPDGTLTTAGSVEVLETILATSCQEISTLNITIHRVPETGPTNHIDPVLYP